MIELHGGRLAVESELGSGSTFTVYLPLDVQPRRTRRRRATARSVRYNFRRLKPHPRPKERMLSDYHVHLRPDGPGSEFEKYMTAENADRYRAAAEEAGIEELGVSEHIYRFKQALAIWDHPLLAASAAVDDIDALRGLRARRDRPAARDRGRLRGRPRGPDRRGARPSTSGTT